MLGALRQTCAHEKTVVGEDADPNERRLIARANLARKPLRMQSGRGRGQKEKDLSIAYKATDWKVTALEAGMWVEMIKEERSVWPREGKKRRTWLDMTRRRERGKQSYKSCYRTVRARDGPRPA